MVIADAVLAFTLEVSRASTEAGLAAPPAVEVVELDPRVRAETIPGVIRLNAYAARHAVKVGPRRARPWLRCVARHEVAHRALGHVARSRAEARAFEAPVAEFLRARWKERDAVCDAYLR